MATRDQTISSLAIERAISLSYLFRDGQTENHFALPYKAALEPPSSDMDDRPFQLVARCMVLQRGCRSAILGSDLQV